MGIEGDHLVKVSKISMCKLATLTNSNTTRNTHSQLAKSKRYLSVVFVSFPELNGKLANHDPQYSSVSTQI